MKKKKTKPKDPDNPVKRAKSYIKDKIKYVKNITKAKAKVKAKAKNNNSRYYNPERAEKNLGINKELYEFLATPAWKEGGTVKTKMQKGGAKKERNVDGPPANARPLEYKELLKKKFKPTGIAGKVGIAMMSKAYRLKNNLKKGGTVKRKK